MKYKNTNGVCLVVLCWEANFAGWGHFGGTLLEGVLMTAACRGGACISDRSPTGQQGRTAGGYLQLPSGGISDMECIYHDAE